MKHFAIAATVIAWFSSALLLAQDVPMFPGPVKEHEVLKKFVGEWETQSEAVMAPGQPAMKCQGSINALLLGRIPDVRHGGEASARCHAKPGASGL
jgi:hypothetical protein